MAAHTVLLRERLILFAGNEFSAGVIIGSLIVAEAGIYLQARGTSSVFLPQVAPEQGWDLTTTLRKLERKAGLPAEGWRDGQLYRFTAEVVHGEKPRH